MKKKIILFMSLVCILSMFSGCSQEEDNELDDLINQLPSVEDPFDRNNPSQDDYEENTSYISVSGKVLSFTNDNITVKIGNEEQIFYFNSSTNVFGGDIVEEQYVTITYSESDISEQKITALAVTVLNSENNKEETNTNMADENNSLSETDSVTDDESLAPEEPIIDTAANEAADNPVQPTDDEETSSQTDVTEETADEITQSKDSENTIPQEIESETA